MCEKLDSLGSLIEIYLFDWFTRLRLISLALALGRNPTHTSLTINRHKPASKFCQETPSFCLTKPKSQESILAEFSI